MWSETITQIGALHVKGVRRNEPAIRLAVSSQLGSAEFNPAGIPPSAILIVRSMKDPLPGKLPMQVVFTRIVPDWERSVQDKLYEIYRRAVRPERGLLADNADAIVFADEAELIACLTLALSRGEAWQQWWWRFILKSTPPFLGSSVSMTKVLCEKAACIPAVLGLLTDWDKSEKVVQTLKSDDVLNVLSAMLDSYEVKDIAAVVDSSAMSTILGSKEEDKKEPLSWNLIEKKRQHDKEFVLTSHVQKASSPWNRYLNSKAVPRELGKKHACLLGMGLMLKQMPWIARSSDFQAEVVDWWNSYDKQYAGGDVLHLADTGISEGVDPVEEFSTDRQIFDQRSENIPHGLLIEKNDDVSLTKQKPEQSRSKNKSRADVYPDSLKTNQPLRPIRKDIQEELSYFNYEGTTAFPALKDGRYKRDDDGRTRKSINQELSHAEQEREPPIVSGSEEEDISAKHEDFVHTRLGGVFYLINLMLQLDLPQCFEKEWRLTSQVGTWGFLELLGRALLAEESKSFEDDPLWKTLAEMDNRKSGELPGHNFLDADAYRLPVSWFEQVRTKRDSFCWATMRRQLRLWSTSGYLIVEVPRDKNTPHYQAQNELLKYLGSDKNYLLSRNQFVKSPIESPANLKTLGLNKDLVRFFALILPYIRYRLRLIFDQISKTDSNISEQLFLCPGRLYVTPTHVDFLTDINNISIPLRKAGLDRDPGWLADFGRVIKFHFE